VNAAEMAEEGRRLSGLLDKALRKHAEHVQAAAEAERKYRHGRQVAYLQTSGTVDERKAAVDDKTADLRFERDLAEGLRQTALEAIRSRRAQVSLLQSVANAYKAEAGFDRFGPELEPVA
jgi:hypothetical protein